jgi:luciferase family oxidoreductase group 1
MIKLGLLDFGARNGSVSSMGKVLEVMDYAQVADELGYSRFWVSEHHNYSSSAAWANPQMLLPLLLNNTENISIGIAGILLNFYSSYEVALNFKMMENLFPGRVDLGIANGNPPINVCKNLTQRVKMRSKVYTLPTKVKQLHDFFHREDYVAEKQNITIPPYKGSVPRVFALGSSFKNSDFALQYKMHYAKSLFHNIDSMQNERDAILRFKEGFFSKHGYEPEVIITFTGVCAQTEQQAVKIANETGSGMLNGIIGNASYFLDKIGALQEKFPVNEFVFHDVTTDNVQRIESLHMLNEIFNLSPYEV